MFSAKQSIQSVLHVILTCFALFALSPCVVKETLVSWGSVELVKLPGKAKATTTTSSCQYVQHDNLQTSFVQKARVSKHIEDTRISKNLFFVKTVGIGSSYSTCVSTHSPPLYILYKRLKLDIA